MSGERAHPDAELSQQQLGELRQRLIDEQCERLTDFEAALKRLDERTYGVSERTGEAIPYERLLALPWAGTTIDEQGD